MRRVYGGSNTKRQKDWDFDSRVDRDLPIAIYTQKYRAGLPARISWSRWRPVSFRRGGLRLSLQLGETARSTFPIVEKLFAIGIIPTSLREETFFGERASSRPAGPGEHGRPGRNHRRLADELVRTAAPCEAHGATREGARAPRDRRDSRAGSMEASGCWYNCG